MLQRGFVVQSNHQMLVVDQIISNMTATALITLLGWLWPSMSCINGSPIQQRDKQFNVRISLTIYINQVYMYKHEDHIEQDIHRQHNPYTNRIIELEAECQEKELRHKELLKKITEITASQTNLQQQFAQYQQQVRVQSVQMQQTLQDRNGCILMLRSQLSAVQQSNQNLYSLLKQSNAKVVQLMKQLTDKNRFIKEYIQKQQDQ